MIPRWSRCRWHWTSTMGNRPPTPPATYLNCTRKITGECSHQSALWKDTCVVAVGGPRARVPACGAASVSCQPSGISRWRCTSGMRVTRLPGLWSCLVALTAARCRTFCTSQSRSCPRIGSRSASWQAGPRTQVSCCLPLRGTSQNRFQFLPTGLQRAAVPPIL